MKKNFFLLGLFAAVAFMATLAINKHSTHNHNQVPAMAEVQFASETTTPTQTSEEPAPVAQVQETNLVAGVITTNTEPTKITIGFRSFTKLDKAPTNHVGQP